MKILSKSRKIFSVSIKIIKETVQGFIDDNVMRLSASLAYATLFSIIPLLSLLFTIGILLNTDLTKDLYDQLEPIVGAKVIDALQSMMANAEKTESFSFATLVSVGVSIFGATTVFAEIQSSLNTIWGIKAVPKKSWLKYIKNRLLSFSVIVVFAFILLITFTISNIIMELSNRFIANYPEVAESLIKVIGLIINIGVTTVIFTLLFKVLPDAKIKIKDVFIGSLVTTILLLIGQWAISLYISFANIETVYGAAAFMAIFITWIYYSAIIIYTGAEFTKAWADELGSKIFPDEYAVATKVIEIHEENKPVT
ncbi:YihY/virulence factor BrkB family protein [uncultured Bacteroides sp.]|uniref:YihY/virulence factor BrkB family protein n=1 Tax=uncultured Bacteroides sp. TaxID=162156 RepID=UPI00260081D8|nr:YihY/virulence factor BrkB family protein [uncultured Bacteroides sp.]